MRPGRRRFFSPRGPRGTLRLPESSSASAMAVSFGPPGNSPRRQPIRPLGGSISDPVSLSGATSVRDRGQPFFLR